MDISMFDAAFSNQDLGLFAHRCHWAAHDCHLQAKCSIEVYVHGGNCQLVMFVLVLSQSA